jgi:hypothetical protein
MTSYVAVVRHLAQAGDDGLDLRLVHRMDAQQRVAGAHARLEFRIGRIVAELSILDQVMQHIDAEAVDAAVEPEGSRQSFRCR